MFPPGRGLRLLMYIPNMYIARLLMPSTRVLNCLTLAKYERFWHKSIQLTMILNDFEKVPAVGSVLRRFGGVLDFLPIVSRLSS